MTREEAIDLARRVAEEEGWPWLEPVEAAYKQPMRKKSKGSWQVSSNIQMRGNNVLIYIDDDTGEVLGKQYRPR